MSSAARRPLAEAIEDAKAFRDLFPVECYERWEIAGSVRRRKSEVADVEHVIIPRVVEEPGSGLFAEPERINKLWKALEEHRQFGAVAKHCYGSTGAGAPLYRWGEKYRGVDFRGHIHEMFTATPINWGAILLIRTGPADYSERVVTKIKSGGMYRQQDGQLIHVASGQPVGVPDEKTYLRLAGMKWLEPAQRC